MQVSRIKEVVFVRLETSTNASRLRIDNNALGAQTDLFCLLVLQERTKEKKTNYSECQTICEKDDRKKTILRTKLRSITMIDYYLASSGGSLGSRRKSEKYILPYEQQ